MIYFRFNCAGYDANARYYATSAANDARRSRRELSFSGKKYNGTDKSLAVKREKRTTVALRCVVGFFFSSL